MENALNLALEAGYRHIDAAPVYFNEKTIGKVLKSWIDAGKVKREELFVVTKLPKYGLSYITIYNCTSFFIIYIDIRI